MFPHIYIKKNLLTDLIICLIYKAGVARELNNYRQISLISTIAKVVNIMYVYSVCVS